MKWCMVAPFFLLCHYKNGDEMMRMSAFNPNLRYSFIDPTNINCQFSYDENMTLKAIYSFYRLKNEYELGFWIRKDILKTISIIHRTSNNLLVNSNI